MNPEDAGLVDRLARGGYTLSVAESCTAGLLGARITDEPGASKVFRGGIIAYGDDVKTSLLGIDPKLLQRAGAVSASVVEAMAVGARARLQSDLALAVSGVAGPGGGTEQKPVGTVWLACVGPGDLVNVHRIQAEGPRSQVRGAAVDAAIALLGRNLDEAEA